jgi:hypothetical protein
LNAQARSAVASMMALQNGDAVRRAAQLRRQALRVRVQAHAQQGIVGGQAAFSLSMKFTAASWSDMLQTPLL